MPLPCPRPYFRPTFFFLILYFPFLLLRVTPLLFMVSSLSLLQTFGTSVSGRTYCLYTFLLRGEWQIALHNTTSFPSQHWPFVYMSTSPEPAHYRREKSRDYSKCDNALEIKIREDVWRWLDFLTRARRPLAHHTGTGAETRVLLREKLEVRHSRLCCVYSSGQDCFCYFHAVSW